MHPVSPPPPFAAHKPQKKSPLDIENYTINIRGLYAHARQNSTGQNPRFTHPRVLIVDSRLEVLEPEEVSLDQFEVIEHEIQQRLAFSAFL